MGVLCGMLSNVFYYQYAHHPILSVSTTTINMLNSSDIWSYGRPQEIGFLTNLPVCTCVHMGRSPLPLVDVNTWSTWKTYRSFETACTMTIWN